MTTYYFSFGHGHTNHDGAPLRNRYCVIEAVDETKARAKMQSVRGQKWCTSYLSPEEIGVERWGLTPITFEELGPQKEETESFS